MTNATPNIIDQMKELREWQQRLKSHGCTDKLAEEQWRKEVWYAFPTIAQSLLDLHAENTSLKRILAAKQP